MGDYNKRGFEKAFKKAVPNFDETKIWFSHKSKMYEPSLVCFVWQGKLWKRELYKNQYHIDLWANHFVDFLNTGEFDYNGYWKVYKSVQVKGGEWESEWVDDKIYKFPLCKFGDNDCYEHSKEMNEFFKSPEGAKIGRQHGIRLVPKPLK